jgi:hypothetical protein
MKKAVNQNRKIPLHVMGHYAFIGAQAIVVLAALFVIWSFTANSTTSQANPADPVTQDDFDKSLEYLNNKEAPNG